MKTDRKGFTLIEMLVAMAVLGIVLGEIGMVLSNTTKIYSKGSYEISLQTEAQQAVQAIEDIMIDATNNIVKSGDNIIVSNKDGTTYTFSLVAKRSDRPYKTLMVNGDIPVAEYVKSMDLDTSAFASKSKVTLKLEFEGEGGYQYGVTKDIYNRNLIGSGGTDDDDLSPGEGQKEINVLRYHKYMLRDYLPYDGRTWDSAAFTNAEAENYYFVDPSDLSLTCADYLNGSSGAVGRYDLVCHATDDSEYKISIYTEAPGKVGDYCLLNAFTTTHAKCKSYFPIKGCDVTKATSCKLEFYYGNGKLSETTIDLAGYTEGTVKNWSVPGSNWFPDSIAQTYQVQLDGGVDYSSEFVGNNVVLGLGRMNRVDGYMSLVDTYEIVHWMNITLTFPDHVISLRAYLYPLEYTFSDPTLFNKYWDVIKTKNGGNTHF